MYLILQINFKNNIENNNILLVSNHAASEFRDTELFRSWLTMLPFLAPSTFLLDAFPCLILFDLSNRIQYKMSHHMHAKKLSLAIKYAL